MPKSIIGSVGRGGKNYPPSDVMTVQYLLNCVPVSQGGPAQELAVDGAAGPKTIAAIENYQRRQGGFADGRVDPGGNTLRVLQARDPYPNQPLRQGGAKGGQAKGAGDPFGQKGFDHKSSDHSAGGGQKSGGDRLGQKAGGGQKTGGGWPNDPFGQKGGGAGQPGAKGGMGWPGMPGLGSKGGGNIN